MTDRIPYFEYNSLPEAVSPSAAAGTVRRFVSYPSPVPHTLPLCAPRLDQILKETIRSINGRRGSDIQVHRMTPPIEVSNIEKASASNDSQKRPLIPRLAALRIYRHLIGRLHLYVELVFTSNGKDLFIHEHRWATSCWNPLHVLWGLALLSLSTLALILLLSGSFFIIGGCLLMAFLVWSYLNLLHVMPRREAERELYLLQIAAQESYYEASQGLVNEARSEQSA